jgi:hypothetical protein
MRKLAVVSAGVLVVLAVTVSPTFAERRAAQASTPVLTFASHLPRTRGASGAPLRWVPLHSQALAQAKAVANAKAGVGGANAARGGGGGGPTVFSLANVSPSFNGTYQTGLTPPDTTGTIGPDRYIEIINTKYAIYNRSGSQLNSGSLSALTGIAGGIFGYNLSDPQMMWDAQTQRFYYSAVFYDSFLSTNGLAVGWSKTATPSSSSDWCQYAIETPDPNNLIFDFLPDYPKLGDSKDFLLYGYNKFADAASTYVDSEFLAVNKPAAGSACADPSLFTVTESGALQNGNGTPAATPVPARLVDDSNGAGYVVANADLTDLSNYGSGANFVSLYTVTTSGTPNVPAISGPTTVTVPTYQMPASAPQAGSAYLLDTLDGRFEAAVAAVDPAKGTVAVWTAHAVASVDGKTVEERWYELSPGSGSPLDSGVVTDPSLFIWNGAISPDRSNTAGTTTGSSWALSVSTSSPTTYPAIRLEWKKAGGASSALTRVVQSNGPLVDFSCTSTTPCRYGDYSGTSPDPAATGPIGKVWLANQYNLASGSTSGTNWRTWILAVTPN